MHQNTRLTYLLLIAIIFFCIAMRGHALNTFANETVNYKVNYKWGLIHKQAGHASLMLRNEGRNYILQLTASSEPWADKFYQVRDTLNGIVLRQNLRPLFYEKIAHEGNEDKHDTVTFSYDTDSNSVTGSCTRRSSKNGKLRVNTTNTLHSQGTTVDMLCAYYYMRSLPFGQWEPGHKTSLTIFSGKRKEKLTIEYHGIQDAKADHKTFSCYHITFIFTSDDGKKTSDDMDAWITTDSRRIPVRLEGKLPVGKVHCVYTGL